MDIEVCGASVLATLGDFDRAEARLAAAAAVAGRVLEADDPRILSIHNLRGIIAKYAGRFDDAQAHYERNRVVIDVEPVVDKEALAVLLHNLGGLDHSRGRISEGLAHAQRGLKLRVDAVGQDHPEAACDLNAISALHHDAGDLAAAEATGMQALRVFEIPWAQNITRSR